MPTPIDPTKLTAPSDAGRGASSASASDVIRSVDGQSIDANALDLSPRVKPPALIAANTGTLSSQRRITTSHLNAPVSERSKPSDPGSTSEITATARTFTPIKASVRNRLHGLLETSAEKAAEGNVVNIKLTRTDISGARFDFSHSVYVTEEDESVRGSSSIGFSYIELPDSMRGRGVAPALLRSMALAGIELEVEEVVIDSVVGHELHKLLSDLQMVATVYGYHLPPRDLLRNLDRGQATAHSSKRWQ